MAELHFEQRKEDDAKLDELANLIETTKQVWSHVGGLAVMTLMIYETLFRNGKSREKKDPKKQIGGIK